MDQIKIGQFIASLRRENGLTQAQLAGKLNITDRAVSKWENGKCLPDSSIMLELCSILGISVNELLSGERVKPEKAPQTAEENLIALKKTEENGRTKNRKFRFLLTVCIIALAGVITVYAGSIASKQKERDAYQKELSGMYRTVGDSEILTDEAQKIVHLITGATEGTFLFSYQVDESYDRLILCCDTYRNGVKVEETVLIDHAFVKSPDNANALSTDSFKVKILSGWPRHGYLFIDCTNRNTACTDEYYVHQTIYQEDGSVLEDLGENLTDYRVPGKYPDLDAIWGYRFNLGEKVKASDGRILPEHAISGEPIYLVLEGDDTSAEPSSNIYFKNAEEILASPELIARFDVCNVFYCFFE